MSVHHMEVHHETEWRQALAVARLSTSTGMVPVKCSTILALQAELERLSAELRDGDDLRERLGDILRRTAVALRGPEPPLTSWSWHDLPERAAEAQAAERAALIELAEKQCLVMKNEDPFEGAVRDLCEHREMEQRRGAKRSTAAQDSAGPEGSAVSEGLGPLPLWRDDAGRSWWGADELTGAHLLAWRDAAVAAERERCAKLSEPTGPRPCDCERCDCGNATDARMVVEWDEAAALARRIRGA